MKYESAVVSGHVAPAVGYARFAVDRPMMLRRGLATRAAVMLRTLGGPEVLQNALETVPKPDCKPGQVGVDVNVVGVNMHDTYVRTGLYPSELPTVMGAEGAGTVTAVGDGVSHLRIGDRVAFFEHSTAYTDHAVVNEQSCFRIPDGLSDQLAVGALVQGFTAHYLACDTFALQPGHIALVHAAAGGTGALLTQIAKLRGAKVIATVSNDSKAKEARAAGADAVVVYGDDYDFERAVLTLCPGGVDVVYDSIGKATASASLATLKPRGTCVYYGNSSGAPEAIAPTPALARGGGGSLYVTRPLLEHYMLTEEERARRASETFGWVADGRLHVRIAREFALGDAARAHEFLHSRKARGKVLLATA